MMMRRLTADASVVLLFILLLAEHGAAFAPQRSLVGSNSMVRRSAASCYSGSRLPVAMAVAILLAGWLGADSGSHRRKLLAPCVKNERKVWLYALAFLGEEMCFLLSCFWSTSERRHDKY